LPALPQVPQQPTEQTLARRKSRSRPGCGCLDRLSISACHLRALRPEKIAHEVVLKRLAELSKERFYVNTGRTLRALRRKTQNNIMTRDAPCSK